MDADFSRLYTVTIKKYQKSEIKDTFISEKEEVLTFGDSIIEAHQWAFGEVIKVEQQGEIFVGIKDEETKEKEVTGPTECDIPPPGWECTRGRGHDGPCAANPESGILKGFKGYPCCHE